MKEMFEKASDSVSKFAKSVGDNSKKLASKVKLNKTIKKTGIFIAISTIFYTNLSQKQF